MTTTHANPCVRFGHPLYIIIEALLNRIVGMCIICMTECYSDPVAIIIVAEAI